MTDIQSSIPRSLTEVTNSLAGGNRRSPRSRFAQRGVIILSYYSFIFLATRLQFRIDDNYHTHSYGHQREATEHSRCSQRLRRRVSMPARRPATQMVAHHGCLSSTRINPEESSIKRHDSTYRPGSPNSEQRRQT